MPSANQLFTVRDVSNACGWFECAYVWPKTMQKRLSRLWRLCQSHCSEVSLAGRTFLIFECDDFQEVGLANRCHLVVLSDLMDFGWGGRKGQENNSTVSSEKQKIPFHSRSTFQCPSQTSRVWNVPQRQELWTCEPSKPTTRRQRQWRSSSDERTFCARSVKRNKKHLKIDRTVSFFNTSVLWLTYRWHFRSLFKSVLLRKGQGLVFPPFLGFFLFVNCIIVVILCSILPQVFIVVVIWMSFVCAEFPMFQRGFFFHCVTGLESCQTAFMNPCTAWFLRRKGSVDVQLQFAQKSCPRKRKVALLVEFFAQKVPGRKAVPIVYKRCLALDHARPGWKRWRYRSRHGCYLFGRPCLNTLIEAEPQGSVLFLR